MPISEIPSENRKISISLRKVIAYGPAQMNRFGNFMFNTAWLSDIVGNRCLAAYDLVKFKLSPCYIARGHWGDRTFAFRKSDLSGLNEILIDREYEFLSQDIAGKKDFSILDCGAHIGLPILWALTVNPSIKVLSVEASPDTFKILSGNCAGAKADWKTIHRACWSTKGEICFSTRGDSMSHRAETGGKIKVATIPLSDLINQLSPDKNINLMKVDIEGAEEEFLCAAPELLSRIDSIVIELHPKLCNTDRVRDTLAAYFPRIEEVGGRKSSKPLLYCRKA